MHKGTISKAISGAGAWMIAAAGNKGAPTSQTTSGDDSPIGNLDKSVKAEGNIKQVEADNALEAGRDAFGNKLYKADGDLHVHEAPVATPAYQVPKVVEKKPVLVIARNWGDMEVTYDSDDALWKADSKGKRMLVIPVTNPIPEDGGESIKAYRISVHLVFKWDHFLMDIERAYWIGESSNEVDFIAGKKRNVLIGFRKNNEWCSFENTHSEPQIIGDWHRTWRDDPEEKCIPFRADRSLNFEVSVLYTARSGTVSVIDRKSFVLKVIQETGVCYCEAVKP